MTDIAIRVSNLSKCYQIYDTPRDRLKQFVVPELCRAIPALHKFFPTPHSQPPTFYKEFWALKDVSFEVKRGEAVGIIGRNGAGKSTLLQIITGTLSPSSGDVQVSGTVAALLELGSGFNQEFTGRENIYLTASVLGLTQDQIDQRFDEIAAFADIGDFINQPIHTYSSGMIMRLAFAVNTCVDPDILIVDEALSVGDAPFQSKCFKRLRKLIDDGTSILFVSHDISTVRSICSRALWLKNGHAEMWGDAMEVAKEYEKFCWEAQGVTMKQNADVETPPEIESIAHHETGDSNTENAKNIIGLKTDILFSDNPAFTANEKRTGFGTRDVEISNLVLLNKDMAVVNTFEFNEKLTVLALIKINKPVDSEFSFGLRIKDLKGHFIYSAGNYDFSQRITGNKGDTLIIRSELHVPLHHQHYVALAAIFGFDSGLARPDGHYDYSRAVLWHSIDEALFFSVQPFGDLPQGGPVSVEMPFAISKFESNR